MNILFLFFAGQFLFSPKKSERFPMFDREKEKVYTAALEREDSPVRAIYVKWDSNYVYLGIEKTKLINLILGIGTHKGDGTDHPEFLPFKPIFIRPLSLFILLSGDSISSVFKFSQRDSEFVAPRKQRFVSLPGSSNFFVLKIVQDSIANPCYTLYFSILYRNESEIVETFPPLSNKSLRIPVYALMVDADEDSIWDMDIIPRAMIQIINPREFNPIFLNFETNNTTVIFGHSSFSLYFVLKESAYISAILYNQTGQKIEILRDEKWVYAGENYNIEWKGISREGKVLPSGRYLCVLYLNKIPYLKIPISLLK